MSAEGLRDVQIEFGQNLHELMAAVSKDVELVIWGNFVEGVSTVRVFSRELGKEFAIQVTTRLLVETTETETTKIS